jgi:hypothetical protein
MLTALIFTLTAAGIASAQWDSGGSSMAVGVSYAYSGNDNGFRLELGGPSYVLNAGWFKSDYRDAGDGSVIALEAGMNPGEFLGNQGMPFVVGVGAYRHTPDDDAFDDSDSFNFWAGLGDFEHSTTGLFYQYRYIFGGPLSGSQGVLGWAF